MRFLPLLPATLLLLTATAAAQDPAPPSGAGTVIGVVHDSLAGRPLAGAACGGGRGKPPAAVVGIVRNAADEAPIAGAIVESAWLEYDVGRRAVTRRRAGAADTTAADGRFTLCDVPRGGSLALRARRGDTTAILELQVPATGLLRRDLYLGAARAETTISGVVYATPKRPLADAQVSIEGGLTTRSTADGRWTLAGAPLGTRVLEVRRVGYYPTRLPVDVVPGAPPVEVTLPEFQAVLDTVRVTASRIRLATTGFETRRRSMGAGRFITTADLLRQPVLATSDLFVRIPGMRVDRAALGETRITMRGIFGRCRPSVYLNGMYMSALSAEDIDAFVHPDEIAGVEVYSGTFVPAEFQQAFGGCGSIVIWTKVGESPVRGWSPKHRALWGAGAVALGAAIGVLFANH